MINIFDLDKNKQEMSLHFTKRKKKRSLPNAIQNVKYTMQILEFFGN